MTKVELSKKEIGILVSVLSEKMRDLASHLSSSESSAVSIKDGIYLNAIKKVSPLLKKFESLENED